MFLKTLAIRPVPVWAVVGEQAIEEVEERLDGDEDHIQETLDAGYNELDRMQPILAGLIANEIADQTDELVQSVGYFLAVTVFLAFRAGFANRMNEITAEALQAAIDSLQTDEELRAEDSTSADIDSSDVIAMGQPALLDYITHHLQEAIEQAEPNPPYDNLERIYRVILVQVIAMSHAVLAPDGSLPPPPPTEVLA